MRTTSCEAIWQAICLVEWPERLGDQLVTKAIQVASDWDWGKGVLFQLQGFLDFEYQLNPECCQDGPQRLEIGFEGFGPQAWRLVLRAYACASALERRREEKFCSLPPLAQSQRDRLRLAWPRSHRLPVPRLDHDGKKPPA